MSHARMTNAKVRKMLPTALTRNATQLYEDVSISIDATAVSGVREMKIGKSTVGRDGKRGGGGGGDGGAGAERGAAQRFNDRCPRTFTE